MSKSDDQMTISHETQLNIRKKRAGFPVDMVDWERLQGMIENLSPRFAIWANIGTFGISSALSIFLTWVTIGEEANYPYKGSLLFASFVMLIIGIMAGIFAWDKNKDEEFSKKQILKEMKTMEVSSEESSIEEVISNRFKIVKATYGIPGKNIDVTEQLIKLIVNDKLRTKASNSLAGDPVEGTPKTLVIKYEVAGQEFEEEFAEEAIVNLP